MVMNKEQTHALEETRGKCNRRLNTFCSLVPFTLKLLSQLREGNQTIDVKIRWIYIYIVIQNHYYVDLDTYLDTIQ